VKSADDAVGSTLYSAGFEATRFVEVIENELVWEILGQPAETLVSAWHHIQSVS
jgi:hypothetical protein